ncbi:hypothetical protein ACP70R_004177 [Stipagrostis hirtigluma subsp. patula]
MRSHAATSCSRLHAAATTFYPPQIPSPRRLHRAFDRR